MDHTGLSFQMLNSNNISIVKPAERASKELFVNFFLLEFKVIKSLLVFNFDSKSCTLHIS